MRVPVRLMRKSCFGNDLNAEVGDSTNSTEIWQWNLITIAIAYEDRLQTETSILERFALKHRKRREEFGPCA